MKNRRKYVFGFIAALTVGSSANAATLINWVTGDVVEAPFERCYQLANFFDGLECYGGLSGPSGPDSSGFSVLSEAQRKAVIDGKVERKIAPKETEIMTSRKAFDADILKFLGGDHNSMNKIWRRKHKCIKAGGVYMTNSHGSMCLKALAAAPDR